MTSAITSVTVGRTLVTVARTAGTVARTAGTVARTVDTVPRIVDNVAGTVDTVARIAGTLVGTVDTVAGSVFGQKFLFLSHFVIGIRRREKKRRSQSEKPAKDEACDGLFSATLAGPEDSSDDDFYSDSDADTANDDENDRQEIEVVYVAMTTSRRMYTALALSYFNRTVGRMSLNIIHN